MPGGGAGELGLHGLARWLLAATIAVCLVVGGVGPAALARADEPTLEQAIEQLRAPGWSERSAAVYALQRRGSAAGPAAAALLAALGDDNGLVRIEAAEALRRIGAAAVPDLIGGLSSPDEQVRLACAQTLGRIGLASESALPALRAAAADDASAEVRTAAELAVSMVAPASAADWARKALYVLREEPEGILVVGLGIAGLQVLALVGRALRRRRQAGAAAAQGGAQQGEPGDEAGDDEADDDRDEVCDEHETGGIGERPAAGEAGAEDDERTGADAEGALASQGDAGAARSAGRPARRAGREPAFAPPQGLPHALAGLAAMAVGGAVLATVLSQGRLDADQRHAFFLGVGVWMLVGYLFVRLGLAGEMAARRARRRAATEVEPWLRDRAWSREGTGPVEAARVAPNLLPLALYLALLAPFHTVWRVPPSWWGFWLALGILDLLAILMVVVAVRRVWSGLQAGRCFLRWQAVPVAPGGRLAARFESRRSLEAAGLAKVTLRCMRDRAASRQVGDEAAPDAEEIWSAQHLFPVYQRPEGGSWIDLAVPVPADSRGTSSWSVRPVRWLLSVEIPTAGPDFRTTFPVPVYARAR